MTRRKVVDGLLAGLAAGFVALMLVRAFLAVTPVVAVVIQRFADRQGPQTSSAVPLETTLSYPLRQPAFMTWWGGRRAPRTTGDSYLEALGRRPLAQNLGSALGAVVLAEQAKGVRFTRVAMIPGKTVLKKALLGTGLAAHFTRADGSTHDIRVAHPRFGFTRLSRVPTTVKEYWPLLSDSQLAAIAERARIEYAGAHIFVVHPRGDASGEWVLYSRTTTKPEVRREFYLVPAELAPQGLEP